MQGTILSIASQSNQGVIIGDDGNQYTYTVLGWRDSAMSATPGMKVDFDVRGSHAVAIYPLPGTTPSPYANPGAAQGSFQPLPTTYQTGGVQPPPTAPTPSVQSLPTQATSPPPAAPTPPAPSPPSQATQYNPGASYPTAQTTPAETAKPGKFDIGKILEGMAWMCLLSTVLAIFLPFIGPIIGGFVGGRKSGSFANSAIAALISAVLIGGITFLLMALIVGFVESLPIIGFIFSLTGMGDFLTGAAVIVALANALPMLVFALIGGATKS